MVDINYEGSGTTKTARLIAVAIAFSIFVIELLLALIISEFMSGYSAAMLLIIDALLLTILLGPILYVLPYRYLVREINKCETASEFNKVLLDTIPFGLDIVDEEGNILFLIDRLKKMDPSGKKCWELYRDDKTQCKDCPLLEEIKIGKTSTIEADNCLGGRTLQITHTGMIYKGKKAVLETFEDITNRVEASRLREEFNNIIAHELRAPLSVVKEGIDLAMLPETGVLNDKQVHMLDITKRSVDRLTNYVNDLLDSAKVEIAEPIKKNFNFSTLIEENVEEFNVKAMNKGLKINLDIPSSHIFLRAEESLIGSVVTNLLSNAVKCTEAGHIDVGVKIQGGEIECSVCDTGSGISDEDIPKLFDKFKTMRSSKCDREKSSGLGLYITKKIIEKHGGRIWAESKLGEGTKFIFTLPYHQ